MKKINGYKIDFANNTLTINYKFEAAANTYGTAEYKLYKNILNDFPQIKVVVKSGREQKTPRYNKRLTYANMATYISTFANAEKLMEQFEIVKVKSKIEASPYKYVCDWFKSEFPHYKETPIFEEQNKILDIVKPTAKVEKTS